MDRISERRAGVKMANRLELPGRSSAVIAIDLDLTRGQEREKVWNGEEVLFYMAHLKNERGSRSQNTYL